MESVVVEELRELIEALAYERARTAEEEGESLDIHLQYQDDGDIVARAVPLPPATESEIAEAERALGRSYPAEYAALLSVANGFPDYLFGEVLLGTGGVGTAGVAGIPEGYPATVWGIAREYIDEWYESHEGPLEHSPVDRADCIPLVSDDNASGAVYVVATSGPGWEGGTVVGISGEGIERYGSIREFLRARLALTREA